MGLLNFFWGKKKNQSQSKNQTKSNINEEQIASLMEAGKRFDHEIIEAFQRYYSDPDVSIEIEVKDDKGNIYPAHMVYEKLFAEWLGIQSKWDRMSLLYRFWDDSQVQKPEDWQIIERYVKDRYPTLSLKYFEEHRNKKENFSAKELVAISKMYRSLLKDDEARKYIETAYQDFPDEDIVKVEYATVLHLSKNHDEKEKSHKIFHEVLDKKIKKEDTESVFECFLFSEGYVDSSVFAMSYLITAEAGLDQWEILSEEYYHCPLFRYEHAVKLSQSNEALRALAKLTSLSQEFPWFKTALETTVKNIQSMRVQLNKHDFMEKELQEFQTQLNN
jgi:tetratricopeptide (TPR) repeat protein